MTSGPQRHRALAVSIASVLAASVLVGCGAAEEPESREAARATDTQAPPQTGDDANEDADDSDGGNDAQGDDGAGTDPDAGDGDSEDGGGTGDDGSEDDGEEPSTTNEVVIGPPFNDPRRVDFGPVQPGDSATATIRIRNFHDAPRTLIRIAIAGENATDFSVNGGDCAVGLELAEDASCTIELTFAPGIASPTGSISRRGVLVLETQPGFGRQILLRGSAGLEQEGPTLTNELQDRLP